MAGRRRRGGRADGGGTVRTRRDGRPEGKHTVRTPAGFKRKSITGGKGRTEEELAAEMRRRIVAAEGRVFTEDEDLSPGEFLERWLKDAVRGTIRGSTYSRDRYLVASHVSPLLGYLIMLDTYSRMLPGMDGLAADALADALGIAPEGATHEERHEWKEDAGLGPTSVGQKAETAEEITDALAEVLG